ncbi:thioesterase family protein [uncultured Psychroserpens sp.]|uniref:acyl-CoA thioesterase n=1 Tax=uncultured Psychroserpens sp. TaxID=255436 RepID=UPI00261A8687|nr:thioesterase family protein [uncultured Psychroserpens sp.]
MYKKDFEIRWSDVDANGHLANSAYVNYMSHTRVDFFKDKGLSIEELFKNGIGPIMFSEQIYYFKESFLSETISVSLSVSGLSEDGMFFKFEHNFYDKDGKHLASCDVLGSWIDLKTRKLTILPKDLKLILYKLPKSEDFKTLTKEDMRNGGKRPKNLS